MWNVLKTRPHQYVQMRCLRANRNRKSKYSFPLFLYHLGQFQETRRRFQVARVEEDGRRRRHRRRRPRHCHGVRHFKRCL